MVTAIYAIVIFCLLIFVHELGHFLTAKAVGIKVNEFALGMGPKILSFGKKETTYSLRAFPIGGFVSMEGEDEDSDHERAFNKKPAWARAIVIVAGSVMNFLTAIVIIAIIVLIVGVTTNVIGIVSPGSPAEEAGLLPGDRIVAIEGASIDSWQDVINGIGGSQGDRISLTVERGNERISIISDFENSEGRRIIGIQSKPEHAVLPAIKAGVLNILYWTREMFFFLGQLFTGQGSMNDLMGPVGIVSTINDQAKYGILSIANLAALISLNLAIVNMLPFPALDGGKLLFLVIRRVTGKAITDEMEGKIHFAGLMLLFGLMIYLVIQDFGRFVLG
ncbi:MAG: RIP metalloprotease RseP [Anaerovoracaceae bacterium]|jgi:regulator of sigma E protease